MGLVCENEEMLLGCEKKCETDDKLKSDKHLGHLCSYYYLYPLNHILLYTPLQINKKRKKTGPPTSLEHRSSHIRPMPTSVPNKQKERGIKSKISLYYGGLFEMIEKEYIYIYINPL